MDDSVVGLGTPQTILVTEFPKRNAIYVFDPEQPGVSAVVDGEKMPA